MEPQQENKQNNSNEPIRIIPTRGGGVSSATGIEGGLVPSLGMGVNTTDRPIPKALIQKEQEDKIVFSPHDKVVISPLHTYADDVKNAIQTDGVSMAKIVMAEAKKHEANKMSEEELSPTSDKNKNIIIISVAMLLIAILGFVGTWYFVGKRDSVVKFADQQHKLSIIPYDEEFAINLEMIERKKLIENFEQSKKQNYQKETAIVYLPISYKNSTSTLAMSAGDFLQTLGVRASPSLVRSFGKVFMFGINKTSGKSNPFILLYSDSFNQMYAGMLEWESAIADDIGDLFFTKEDLVDVSIQPATSTSVLSKAVMATGTTSTTTSFSTTSSSTDIVTETSIVEQKSFKSRYVIANSLKFKDEVLNNRDMRVLRTTSGKVLLYYTFINDQILLIAKDFETLDEVVKRLATSQFKQ